jgi:hypothetical protein
LASSALAAELVLASALSLRTSAIV